MGEIARGLKVTGRVQGVFFRAWAQKQAAALGVNGWVRNCPDGSVEAHLEGAQDCVERLVDKISDGPPSAKVDDVEIENAEHQGFDSFDVRR